MDNSDELEQLYNNLYRNNCRSRKLIGSLMFLVVIAGALVITALYQIINRPDPKYFSMTTDARVVPFFPLSEAMLAPSELVQWAHHAAVAAYTYNFINYRDVMLQLQNQFTPSGWKYYEDVLKTAGILEMVIAKKMVVSAVATGTPVILDQAVIDDKYSWKVQIPLLVTYQNANINEQLQQAVIITMIINRVPVADMPKGVAIVSFASSVLSGSTSE